MLTTPAAYFHRLSADFARDARNIVELRDDFVVVTRDLSRRAIASHARTDAATFFPFWTRCRTIAGTNHEVRTHLGPTPAVLRPISAHADRTACRAFGDMSHGKPAATHAGIVRPRRGLHRAAPHH